MSEDQFCPSRCLSTVFKLCWRQKKPPSSSQYFVIIIDKSFQYSQLDTGYFPRGNSWSFCPWVSLFHGNPAHPQYDLGLLQRLSVIRLIVLLWLLFGHCIWLSCHLNSVLVSRLLFPAKSAASRCLHFYSYSHHSFWPPELEAYRFGFVFKVFWCRPVFKGFIQFVTTLLLFYVLSFFGPETCGSYFPKQGSNPHLLCWKAKC